MRLFAGIALDDATRRACAGAIDELQRTGFAAKFEAVDKLHVTLAFLANVESERYAGIEHVLEDAATNTRPFTLRFDRVGAFPHERKPRIVYVGSRDQGPDFRALCARLRSGYGQLGFTFKEDAVAHVTIARVKEPRRPLALIEIVPIAMEVRALSLFESIHDKERNTSRYEIAQRWVLKS